MDRNRHQRRSAPILPQPLPTAGPDPPDDETPFRLTRLREMQLVEAHRKGDPEAIGELLRAYQRRIFAVCVRMVGHREDALDLTQDVLVKIMEALDRYDGRAALSTWVIRIAMNASISHLRRRKVRKKQSLDEPIRGATTSLAANLPARREPTGPDSVERDERAAAVVRALDRLDPAARAILILRDLQDLDYQEVSEVLEVPLGTVKSRLFRARASLREACEAEGIQERTPSHGPSTE